MYPNRINKSLAIVLLVAILLVSVFPTASQVHAATAPVTVELPIVNDYYVDESGNYPAGDGVYNAKSGNWVGSSSDPEYGEARAAVKFDLSSLPTNASISSAELKIYVNDALGSPDSLTVWGSFTNDWDDNRTSMLPMDEKLSEKTGDIAIGQWLSLPVTGFAERRLAADKLVSLVLTGNATGNASFNFNSMESTDSEQYGPANHPVLTVTYSIKSSNADLSDLSASNISLTPVFNAGTTSYSASVANEVASVDLTPTLADSTASVTVNGSAVANGTAATVELDVGVNDIAVEVTAENGTTKKTYTVTITRAESSNADLSGLELNAGELNPAFEPAKTEYVVSVGNSVASMEMKPTVADSTASVAIEGAEVPGGSTSSVPLAVGANEIEIVVTAQDGTEKTYKLTVTRAKSSNANLSGLELDEGELSPTFDPSKTEYAVSVGNDVSGVELMATVADSTATLTIDGEAVTSGSSRAVPLIVGPNEVEIVVTAQDGTKKIYTVTVTRAESNNADLNGLEPDVGTLSPTFDPAKTEYAVSIGNSVSSIELTATVADNTATLTIDGEAVTSGTAFSIPINVGSNEIEIVVTAQDGTEKTYTVLVSRAESSNADLVGLEPDVGTLSPTFDPAKTEYAVSVGNSVSSIELTATVADNTATLTIDGEEAISGTAFPIPINVGSNEIEIVVTAQDGTEKTYTVAVTRAESSNADLSGLELDEGELSPTFDPAKTEYAVSVGNSVSSIELTATVADNTATLTIDGEEAISGTAFPIPINVGSNEIEIVVTAQDGTEKTYTVTVTRVESSNADLSGLELDEGELSPTFDPAKTEYEVSVANSVSNVEMTAAVADNTATLTVNGEDATSGTAFSIPTNVGSNKIKIIVTAQDGTEKTYTVTVTRAESSNADLIGLETDVGELSPIFDPAKTEYAVSVGNSVSIVELTAAVADNTATLTIDGEDATSGTVFSIPINVGPNEIRIVVTAQDGTELTYTVTVTRAESSNADLSVLETNVGTLNPSFDPAKTEYEVSVGNSVSSIELTATAADNTATLTVDDEVATSGTVFPIPINVGSNEIEIVVTAQNSTEKTYTITVTRAESSNAYLIGLETDVGTLSPTFDPAKSEYALSVGNSVSIVELTSTVADSTATLTINNEEATNGTAQAIPLEVGLNEIKIVVTAQDGTEKMYTITVTRAESSNADLSGLELDEGELSPTFDPAKTEYEVSVGNSASSVELTATVADSTATLTINNEDATSGTAQAIPLEVGLNEIKIVVTAQDGTDKTYSVTVTRAESSNADLSGLKTDEGELSPMFDPAKTEYAVSVGNSVSGVELTATVADSTATLTIDGEAVTSGFAKAVSVAVGPNEVEIVVTAQDGTEKTYTVTVIRAESSNANLSGLELDVGELSPSFDPAKTEYAVSVANSVSSVNLNATVADSTAMLMIDGEDATSGTARAVLLAVGPNEVEIVVKAQDGTEKTYTVIVTRAESSNADLSGLDLNVGTLNPSFDPAKTEYALSVGSNVSSFELTATVADSMATLTIDGEEATSGIAFSHPIIVGPNEINILVTAQDGTEKTYTVTVTRAESSNASLSRLETDKGTLGPTFDPTKTEYALSVGNSVSSLELTATVADSTATVAINGAKVASGSASAVPLAVGSNEIKIVVTAQDGTEKTYTVTVTRAESSNADLSGLDTNVGTLNPSFDPAKTEYSLSVGNGVSSVELTPTVADRTSKLMINGEEATSGISQAIPLAVGANKLELVITAQDGTEKAYNITITRAFSSNANLSSLATDPEGLSPSFAPGFFSYNLNTTATELKIKPTAADPASIVKVMNAVVASGSQASLDLKVGANTITVTVVAQDGVTEQTYSINVIRSLIDSNPGPGPGTIFPPGNQDADSDTGTDVEQDDESTVFTDDVDSERLTQLLTQLGPDRTISIPVSSGANAVSIRFNGSDVYKLAEQHVLAEVRAPIGTYTVPAADIPFRQLLSEFGQPADVSDIVFTIEISISDKDNAQLVEKAASESDYRLLVPPVDFSMSATYRGRTIEIERFNRFVERRIPIPDGTDSSRISTAVVLNTDGSLRPVPTRLEEKDGRTIAIISSLTNSTYAIVGFSPKFDDIARHWAADAIRDLASRLIVRGGTSSAFNPNVSITRAEFIAIVVRALGLPEDGETSRYADVRAGDWFRGAVSAAQEYGLIQGASDGRFLPLNTISRQEAMVILSRAMELAGMNTDISAEESEAVLSKYADYGKIGAWAKQAAAASVQNQLITGNEAGIMPLRNLTRAETAAVVQRFLANAGLI
ncbi:cadherin-like beta sandwich domain-containing protein [Cohnella thailandensis]|uniref:Cadherin-like beta sandwich domain-containing protein n=1 Tax=Cohnella thailandensis TaxID=557557 RepID=A0A841SX19_9BACL|nr:cadherin-like beta sandwich domain-containing protein [Cohnella thailandensis]MBB6634695.1 cadherin-like beta sandwich domain-containing protein [Cohnella thailandensis]MBP1972749.1 hypothetical protein [Cohnella thailandensis]